MAAETIMAAHTHPGQDLSPVAQAPFNALVTGGAQGIGAATVRKLASRDMNVLIADMSIEGKKLAQEIKDDYKVDAVYQYVDVRREEDIDMMIKVVVQRWGRLDYAANVAGICQDAGELMNDETKVSKELFDRTYEINQRGVWLCQRAEAQQMASQEPRPVTFSPSPAKEIPPQRGSIVNVASTAALGAFGFPAYTPTKAAIVAMTRNGAYFYGKQGIRCNSISPGATVTGLARSVYPDSLREQLTENDPALAVNVPLRKNAWPEEMANVISFFLSGESSHVTGADLEVDGGLSQVGMLAFG